MLMLPLYASAQERPFEIKGDRTMLYPQLMDLDEDATLLDVLLRYPDMMQSGFSDMLCNFEPEKAGVSNSGYELRMDNVAIAGNIRTTLSTIKAKDVKQVQVCDNPGVAKSTGGLKGVIDINMLKPKEGTHGSAELQVSNDGMVTPIVSVTHGSQKNDIFALASYEKPPYEPNTSQNNTYVFAEMTSRITPKDKLLSYFSLKQNNNITDNSNSSLLRNNESMDMLARFRWFHTFNDKGTELLTLLGYQYGKAPAADAVLNKSLYRSQLTRIDKPMALLELNTPLFVDGLNMMLGWECDITRYRYDLSQKSPAAEDFRSGSTYTVVNNDLYLQFNYDLGMVRVSVGDRIQFYHYQMTSSRAGKWSRNAPRNLWQASIVVTPTREQQVQLSYNRKVIHPPYTYLIPEVMPTINGYYTYGNTKLNEATADIFKVAYGFHLAPLTANAALSFINSGNYPTVRMIKTDVATWANAGEANTWKLEASASYSEGDLSVSAGANIYSMKVKNAKSAINFAQCRLSGDYKLPEDFKASGTLILFTSDSPIRESHNNCMAYGQLSLTKSFTSHLRTSLMWHDIFEKQRSAILGSLSYIF